MAHLPLLWRFRLLRAIHAKGVRANRQFLGAWAQAEGGTAAFNPLNSTEPWPGATPYNTIPLDGGGVIHVWNYPSGAAGIAATAATLANGRYGGIVADLREGKRSALEIATRNSRELDTWGTGGEHVIRLLT